MQHGLDLCLSFLLMLRDEGDAKAKTLTEAADDVMTPGWREAQEAALSSGEAFEYNDPRDLGVEACIRLGCLLGKAFEPQPSTDTALPQPSDQKKTEPEAVAPLPENVQQSEHGERPREIAGAGPELAQVLQRHRCRAEGIHPSPSHEA